MTQGAAAGFVRGYRHTGSFWSSPMQRFSPRAFVARPLLLALLLAACGRGATEPKVGQNAAKARWATQGPSSYTMVVRRSCECLPLQSGEVRVWSTGGVVTARRYVSGGSSVAEQYAKLFPSVEELFLMIDDAIARGTPDLRVRYDPVMGYPSYVAFGDPAVDSPLWTVRDVQPDQP